MPEKKLPAPPAPPARYRVVHGGISTATGAHYQGEVLAADELGDDARIQKLLARGSIEVVDD